MATQTLVDTHRPLPLKAILIVLVLLLPFLLYFDTAQSIVAIWNRSDTFTHQYIILPISLWLIWRRRQLLSQMTPIPYGPVLILLALTGMAWLLGDLADVQVVKQYAFAATLILTAVALLGRRISWAIAFPLLFLLLAVPFGEVFIGPLIEFTANFTVAALRATGIPVLREGNTFAIPSGHWSVVEACSGVRYLIASVTLGLLYAHLTYRSRLRQCGFVLVSIVVPIVANGVRAYMIVMIGHLSGMQLAVGVDHLIYGWLFFGLVMFVMFWIGGFWHEDQPELTQKTTNVTAIAATPRDNPVPMARFVQYVACIVAMVAIWPVFGRYMEQAAFNPQKADLSHVQANAQNWQDAPAFTAWQPNFSPSDATLYRFFQRDQQHVGLSLHYYRNQHPGSILISSTNRMLSELDSKWNEVRSSVRDEPILGRQLTVREITIKNASGSLLIWRWYWIDGRSVENNYVGKLLQLKERILMHGDDGAALVVFAPYLDNPDAARQAIHDFLTANLAGIEATLAANQKR
jgi:exosortase A